MPVTEWYVIRSLTIPSSWVALIAAFVLSGLMIRLKYGKKIADLYTDSVFIFVIVWKLSVIITDFSTVIQQPLAILYFNGGSVGIYLGLAIVCIRLLWLIHKQGLSEQLIQAITLSAVLIQSFYQIGMVGLNEGILWQRLLTGIMFFLLSAGVIRLVSKGMEWAVQLMVLFFLAHVFVGVMQPNGVFQTSVMTTMIWTIVIVGMYLFRSKLSKQLEETM